MTRLPAVNSRAHIQSWGLGQWPHSVPKSLRRITSQTPHSVEPSIGRDCMPESNGSGTSSLPRGKLDSKIADSSLKQTWKVWLIFLRICPPQSRRLSALGDHHKAILDFVQQPIIGGDSLASHNSPGDYYFNRCM
jgi:hypothetical protein